MSSKRHAWQQLRPQMKPTPPLHARSHSLLNFPTRQRESSAALNERRTSQLCDAGAPTGVDGLHEALVRGLNQLLRLLVHVPDKERLIQVAMETVVVDRDVNCSEQ